MANGEDPYSKARIDLTGCQKACSASWFIFVDLLLDI